jgi:translation initiation factor IF-2
MGYAAYNVGFERQYDFQNLNSSASRNFNRNQQTGTAGGPGFPSGGSGSSSSGTRQGDAGSAGGFDPNALVGRNPAGGGASGPENSGNHGNNPSGSFPGSGGGGVLSVSQAVTLVVEAVPPGFPGSPPGGGGGPPGFPGGNPGGGGGGAGFPGGGHPGGGGGPPISGGAAGVPGAPGFPGGGGGGPGDGGDGPFPGMGNNNPFRLNQEAQFDWRLKYDDVPTWDGNTDNIMKWLNKN